MKTETWTVKKTGGEELGYIRKLIIDSNTRELSYADVALAQSNRIVRLPWTEFDVRHEGIFLKSADASLMKAVSPSLASPALEFLDVPMSIPGKIGQSRSFSPPVLGPRL